MDFCFLEMDMQDLKFPRFIKIIHEKEANKNKMVIPPFFLEHYEEELVDHTIKFQLPNGRRTRIRFEEDDGVFSGIRTFFNQFPREYGICAMFTYKGEGVFVVNVLNDNLTEVMYAPPSRGKIELFFSNLSKRIILARSTSGDFFSVFYR